MLKQLPKMGLLTLLYIFNGILRTHYWPAALKTAEIILLLKPGKDPKMPESYRPISLLPTISKVLDRLLAKRITTDVTYTQRVPDHQFAFRHKHSTIQQVHRLCHTIYTAFEAKQNCTSAFLDVSQAFDKVWHDGLLYKIKHTLPLYYNLMRSYLSDRTFHTKIKDHTSATFPITAGVPQGSVLGPILSFFTPPIYQRPTIRLQGPLQMIQLYWRHMTTLVRPRATYKTTWTSFKNDSTNGG